MNRSGPHPRRTGEGIRLGSYEIIEMIGEGGMAEVYRCVHHGPHGFERPMVLKGLHSKLMNNPVFQRMFLDEAKLLAQLQHPNIVQVFEVQAVDGVPYMFMEYVPGPTLGALQSRALAVERDEPAYLLRAILQVCHALEYAHNLQLQGAPSGLVHRDVSSGNVMIDAQTGVAKLIDFGIARFDGERVHTQVGILKGKLPYIAPELLVGGKPDRRADVFSVGVLLYRVATRTMPFRGKTVREDMIAGRYPMPSSVAEIPRSLEAIIVRALHPDPRQRYQTAAQLAGDLQEEIAGLGIDEAKIPRWVQELFPAGDWRAQADPVPPDSPMIHKLCGITQPPPRRIRKRWIGLAGLLALAGAALIAVLILVLVGLVLS